MSEAVRRVETYKEKKETYRTVLMQVQRRGGLRVSSAYRTVSERPVMVISGVVPIERLYKERRNMNLRKAEVG